MLQWNIALVKLVYFSLNFFRNLFSECTWLMKTQKIRYAMISTSDTTNSVHHSCSYNSPLHLKLKPYISHRTHMETRLFLSRQRDGVIAYCNLYRCRLVFALNLRKQLPIKKDLSVNQPEIVCGKKSVCIIIKN